MRSKDNPLESTIQRRIKEQLESSGWYVKVMSCNAFQTGVPDLYCFYQDGITEDGEPVEIHRWVDVKRPKGSTFTKAQCQEWTLMESRKLGVWILDGTEPDPEAVLMGPPNFRDHWKPRYDKYLVRPGADILIEEFND